ncbi:hypothetical protein KP509_35G049600 [Ceratopteris richardii]|uniref:Uncharacterized protein n=1 Tax=Ceratopteris richardii TaxID=49495 RepID=A0A8T2QGT1_CERRI|nr:hypothetical protein KP509_35G049600 [Ceratopteris richardii]
MQMDPCFSICSSISKLIVVYYGTIFSRAFPNMTIILLSGSKKMLALCTFMYVSASTMQCYASIPVANSSYIPFLFLEGPNAIALKYANRLGGPKLNHTLFFIELDFY